MKVALRRALIILLPATLLISACGGAASTPAGPTGDAARGQQLYGATCVSCHGPDAKGVAGLGKDLTTSEFAKGMSDADLVAFLKTGRPSADPLNTTGVDMPPRGGNPALTDQDLNDIVAYLRTIQN